MMTNEEFKATPRGREVKALLGPNLFLLKSLSSGLEDRGERFRFERAVALEMKRRAYVALVDNVSDMPDSVRQSFKGTIEAIPQIVQTEGLPSVDEVVIESMIALASL